MMAFRTAMGVSGAASEDNPEQAILDLEPFAFYAIYAEGGFTLDTDSVSSINDLTGNGHHWVQQIGSRQGVVGVETQNDLDVMTLDGGFCYNGPSSLYNVPNGNNTVIFILKSADEAAVARRVLSGRVSGGQRWYMTLVPSIPRLTWTSRADSVSGINKTVGSLTSWSMLLGRREGTTLAASHNNGSETTNTNGSDVVVDEVAIFNLEDQATGSFVGAFASAIIFDRNLTAEEISTVYNYYQSRLAI